ncbi:MAG TPA: alanine--tRNA ligase [Alphaproteobacteria bacterium]|nr:alanine--tRNA ligase [Alphaproteobacteria bacterium]
MTKTLANIRSTFIDYFVSKSHTAVESSPLVPRNDPTLMFVNSGMVQFKNVFTGAETRPYKRATSAQKSVRAGGKHNDLENVGYTARHHTFFEMLGNFSFGDYFKAEAIEFAWELVTKHYGLSKDRLLVTVYHEDDQAAQLWKKIAGFSDDKIIRIKTDANFWRMGDVGPCGPCSEIFIDQGDKLQGGPPGSPDEDGDRFLEFWNLVFMQFEEQAGGGRVALPKPSVDTGMGLERMAAIMQGVTSNYDIDLFKSIIGATADLVKVNPEGAQKPSFRVIADHLRATSFLIADGVLPGNEGRGYVLRRIMRRAMRHAHILGAKEPMIYKLVPELVKQMGTAYPELTRAEPLITATLELEESRFKQMLDRGLKLLDEETGKLKSGEELPGDVAFKLYDTFGFPIDLTQDVLRGKGKLVDIPGFEAAMERQKAVARASWSGSGDAGTSKIWFEVRDEFGATDFLGYSTEKAEGQVKALVQKGARVKSAVAGSDVQIVVNQTPFYGESGGQMGDAGKITTASGAVIKITDTQKEADTVWVHYGKVEKGEIKVGDLVVLEVDGTRRSNLRSHHSATHLLHEALRRRLGSHVTQKGSLVGPDKLRFDFSQPTPISAADLTEVELEVNNRIRLNDEVVTRLMTPNEAIEEGAMALFGEKYGDEVRVLFMGGKEEKNEKGKEFFSVELCGGTHVKRTGDIGLFKIVSESAVSSGVRRIEALTGQAALDWYNQQEHLLKEAANAMKATAAEVPARVAQLMDERKKLEKEVADLRRQVALGGGTASAPSEAPKQVNGINFVSRVLKDVPAKDLKPMADAFKTQIKSGVVALVSGFEDKVSIVVAVTEDLTKRVSAVDLVKTGAEAVGGKGGGGRPDMAQAGGTDIAAMPKAISAIELALTQKAA